MILIDDVLPTANDSTRSLRSLKRKRLPKPRAGWRLRRRKRKRCSKSSENPRGLDEERIKRTRAYRARGREWADRGFRGRFLNQLCTEQSIRSSLAGRKPLWAWARSCTSSGTSTSVCADTGSRSISSFPWRNTGRHWRNAQLRLTGHLESKSCRAVAHAATKWPWHAPPRILRSQAHVIVLPGLWTRIPPFCIPHDQADADRNPKHQDKQPIHH
jgi:hypothetical protein